jgi:hypothetical protein
MSGVKTSLGLVLVLTSYGTTPAGMWFCIGATSSGCDLQTSFIPLPADFCSGEHLKSCDPFGAALDGRLNVYYADGENAQVVKCTYASAYKTCSVIETLSNLPYGIFRTSTGDIWVSDFSCAGLVWKNGIVKHAVGDSLQGITVSKVNPHKSSHVYVGVTGGCTATAAHILDLNDGTSLPSPLGGYSEIPGLTTKLQFSAFQVGAVYLAKDAA